jgi:hypothetical protein
LIGTVQVGVVSEWVRSPVFVIRTRRIGGVSAVGCDSTISVSNSKGGVARSVGDGEEVVGVSVCDASGMVRVGVEDIGASVRVDAFVGVREDGGS